jgi:hypothetical protein
MTAEITIVHRFNFDRFKVHVLYVEFSGGGESWEYSVLEAGTALIKSDAGFGQAAAAAAAAFSWIADNDLS